MRARILSFVVTAALAVFAVGCSSNEDKYVVKTPIPPAPQQAPGTGH
jgi:hypothetical protein